MINDNTTNEQLYGIWNPHECRMPNFADVVPPPNQLRFKSIEPLVLDGPDLIISYSTVCKSAKESRLRIQDIEDLEQKSRAIIFYNWSLTYQIVKKAVRQYFICRLTLNNPTDTIAFDLRQIQLLEGLQFIFSRKIQIKKEQPDDKEKELYGVVGKNMLPPLGSI